ncbi:MAG: cell division protein SepF [Candidatus Improbicoccus pseudotrichonymphae]|uniref:Cell division protein SepF n=1 Tax=Candidatus Improbicoccus pseudotrichonymphae TaxID=3033792 RepID=A0AA48HYI1_9FIRM|nr:MAG: cell division protein SepF [Candidatus Improbicoccus pseudotrichonymphae]
MHGLFEKIRGIWEPISDEKEEIPGNNDYYDENCDFESNSKEPSKLISIHRKSINIACFKPEEYGSKTLTIANELLGGNVVIINLAGVSEDTARRIIDFLRGIVHAKSGKFMKVSDNTYVITPKNVGIVGSELVDELVNNDVYV